MVDPDEQGEVVVLIAYLIEERDALVAERDEWRKAATTISGSNNLLGKMEAERDEARRDADHYKSSYRRSMLVDPALCCIGSESGPNREMLLCGYEYGHEGDHSWVSLPTFPLAAEAERDEAQEKSRIDMRQCDEMTEHAMHAEAALAEAQTENSRLQNILRGDGHRPNGTPSFHMDGCPGCAALSPKEDA